MNIIYISKYTGFRDEAPSRQFFLAKGLAKLGCKILLVGSRSNAQHHTRFFGFSQVWEDENIFNIRLNGPLVSLGFTANRVFSWIIFEVMLLSQILRFRRFSPNAIIVSSLSVMTLLTGVLLKYILNTKLIVEVRDIYPMTLVELGSINGSHPVVRILAWIERLGYRHADLLVSPLENFDRHVANVIDEASPFTWIPMGFDPDFQSMAISSLGAQVADALDELKQSGCFIAVYAGTIGTANAVDHILEAAKLAGPDVHFALIGNGPLKDMYQRQYATSPNISFYPPIPKSDVSQVLSHADVNLLTILDRPIYRYGISMNKMIDYALSGRPFVTNFQYPLKVLNMYDNALCSKREDAGSFAEAIVSAAKLPASMLDEMGEKGRQNVQSELSYDRLATKLLTAVKNII